MNDNITRVASDVVHGLKGQPVILALLCLNSLGIGAACWFLSRLATAQGARLDLILRSCLPGVRP
jgi:hypothetical protein